MTAANALEQLQSFMSLFHVRIVEGTTDISIECNFCSSDDYQFDVGSSPFLYDALPPALEHHKRRHPEYLMSLLFPEEKS